MDTNLLFPEPVEISRKHMDGVKAWLDQAEADTEVLEEMARDALRKAFAAYEVDKVKTGNNQSEVFFNLCHQADKIWNDLAHPRIASARSKRIYSEEWNARYATYYPTP
jgi:hypothetical protein